MKKKKHSLPIILFGNSIIPGYVPFYYRIFLLACKFYRSSKRKILSFFGSQAQIVGDGIKETSCMIDLGPENGPVINKTISDLDNDLKKEEIAGAVKKIKDLEALLDAKKLRFTTPAGTFKIKDITRKNEKTKLWENAWVLANSGVRPGDVVLDIGGASTIFSFLLASMGCEVHVVDNDWGNHGIIYNSKYVSHKMGWNMTSYGKDISRPLPFKDNYFDKVFSICVVEHLPVEVRKFVMKEMNRVLKPGGIVALTMDYDIHRNTPGLDKGLRYSLRDKIKKEVIEPSALAIYGNGKMEDDLPPEFFLGSLFLVKNKG